MAHLVSMPLVQQGEKHYHTHTHTHNYYVPLTEEQADLYMKTKKYTDYLFLKARNDYYYLALNGEIKPAIKPGTGQFMTPALAKDLFEKRKITEMEKDKVTLMTEGIGGLPKAPLLWKQVKTDICCTIITAIFCCCFPCCWVDDCSNIKREHAGIIRLQKKP